jgi:hypothetical protein
MARTHGGDGGDWKDPEESMEEDEAGDESTGIEASEEPRESGGRRERGRRPLAEQVSEYDLQARMADTLDRIAASLDKIASQLGRSGDQRRQGGPPQGFRGRPGSDEFRRDYGNRRDDRYGDNRGNRYPEGRGGGDRYQEGRRGPGRPGRRWGRDS